MNWDNLTERAQRAIMLSQEEAQRLGNDYLGTEHLLLGLIKEGQGVAYRALSLMNINFQYIFQRIESIVKENKQIRFYDSQTTDITLTPRAKRVLELAYQETQELGHNYIGTEHILLGLIREGEGIAAKVLEETGVDLAKIREVILALIGEQEGFDSRRGGPKVGEKTGQKTKTPTLDQFSRDLTQLAKQEKLDPVIGREKEIQRLIQILARRTKNNPVLIGDPGVGKTVIVEGLAQKIAKGEIPDILKGKRVISLDLSGIVAGTKYRGEFEERMKKIMDEIKRGSGEIILFIDELHTVIGAGAAEGSIDASNILKPALARGELRCVGATTLDEYRKYIERDPALERRFQAIFVSEPSVNETIEILKGLRDKYETHHRVKVSKEAIEAAAKLSARYITQRYLPDKAIDLIDEACASVRLRASVLPAYLTKLDEKAKQMSKEKESAIRAQEFEKAAHFRDEEKKIRAEYERKKLAWEEESRTKEPIVTDDDVAAIVSQWTSIPVGRLLEEEKEKLLNMEKALSEKIIGQSNAINIVSNAIRRAKTGLKDPRKPMGAFLFLGPTGVGKTEFARVLAEYLFGSPDALIRFDMSEYMEKFSVSRLIGAPPGYVGYEEGGQLTEVIRRRSYAVILFDEIEKAHPDIYNILLQIFDNGKLTDSQGRIVNFSNTIIILTSNLWGGEKSSKILGFRADKTESEVDKLLKKESLMNELKKYFKPEFLNRLDDEIIFNTLTEDDILKIVDLLFKRIQEEVAENNIKLTLSPEAKKQLAKEGFDEKFGARPLWRVMEKNISNALSEKILENQISNGDSIYIDFVKEKYEFVKVKSESEDLEKVQVPII
jgi:ATP-dependent Clp protease ATP-binding subunit ClpC